MPKIESLGWIAGMPETPILTKEQIAEIVRHSGSEIDIAATYPKNINLSYQACDLDVKLYLKRKFMAHLHSDITVWKFPLEPHIWNYLRGLEAAGYGIGKYVVELKLSSDESHVILTLNKPLNEVVHEPIPCLP